MKVKMYCDMPTTYKLSRQHGLFLCAVSNVSSLPEGNLRYSFEVDFPDELFEPETIELNQDIKAVKE